MDIKFKWENFLDVAAAESLNEKSSLNVLLFDDAVFEDCITGQSTHIVEKIVLLNLLLIAWGCLLRVIDGVLGLGWSLSGEEWVLVDFCSWGQKRILHSSIWRLTVAT